MQVQGRTNPNRLVSWATECSKVAPKVFSVMTAFPPPTYKNVWPYAPSRKCQLTGLLVIQELWVLGVELASHCHYGTYKFVSCFHSWWKLVECCMDVLNSTYTSQWMQNLGLQVSNHLNWKKHIDQMIRRWSILYL